MNKEWKVKSKNQFSAKYLFSFFVGRRGGGTERRRKRKRNRMWCSMHLVIFKWELKKKLSVSEKYIYHLSDHVPRLNVINLCCCFFFLRKHTLSQIIYGKTIERYWIKKRKNKSFTNNLFAREWYKFLNTYICIYIYRQVNFNYYFCFSFFYFKNNLLQISHLLTYNVQNALVMKELKTKDNKNKNKNKRKQSE